MEREALMHEDAPVAIILAAGHGKRMKSERAKVLHEVCGRPMIRYVVEAARGAGARSIVVVVGYGAEARSSRSLDHEPDVVFAHPGAPARHRRRRPRLPDRCSTVIAARPWSLWAMSP